MDLALSNEQEALKDSARAFLEREVPPTLARAPHGAEVDRVWTRMVDLGWPAVAIAEPDGGSGMSFIELLILLEEVGRQLAPGPLFATAGQFVPVLQSATGGPLRDRLLRGVSAGETGTLAIAEERGSWAWDDIATTARRSGGSWTLSGTKEYVVEGATAQEIVVLARDPDARDGDGLGLFAVPGSDVGAEALHALDPSLRLATVTLSDVEIGDDRVLAMPGTAAALLSESLPLSITASAMLIVGACSHILDRTVEYTKTRKQFDQPIGAFQAVKHKLTDMYVAVERARALVYFAGLTIVEKDPRRELASSMAKAAAGDCQRVVVQDGLQLHGGIGYTWEYDLHLYLKRAASLDALLGSSRLHRRRVAARLGLA